MTTDEIRFKLLNAILIGPASEFDDRLNKVIDEICSYINELRIQNINNSMEAYKLSQVANQAEQELFSVDN